MKRWAICIGQVWEDSAAVLSSTWAACFQLLTACNPFAWCLHFRSKLLTCNTGWLSTGLW
eukprot:1160864-Pelagomonas_calceolata.AAC.4